MKQQNNRKYGTPYPSDTLYINENKLAIYKKTYLVVFYRHMSYYLNYNLMEEKYET